MTETATCEKCGTEYERYTIFWTDDTITLMQRQEMREKYDKLCKGCLNDEIDAGGYAIDSQ